MNKFKVGQQVSFVNDTLNGIISKIDNDRIWIETKDGFLIEAEASDLVADEGMDAMEIAQTISLENLKDKEITKRRPRPKTTRKKVVPPMEVDLHIHQLTRSSKGMSNHDMLTLQVDTARRQLEFAFKKRIQRVVFIHGVGEGVLKSELEFLFGRYDNVKYYDADYAKYGLGATEVYIYQNA